MSTCRRDHQGRVGYRNSAKHHSSRTDFEPFVDLGQGSNAAGDLNRHIGFIDQLLDQFLVALGIGTGRIDIDDLQHLCALGDKLVQRLSGGDIMHDILALDGIACDYLAAPNLYLWYYDHRPTPLLNAREYIK